MEFYKYQGAGNDFLIADNRDGSCVISPEEISAVCDRRYGIGADGLMLLGSSGTCDFRMEYFNSDGSGGMMCGNGGRCIVAFAADKGITRFYFEAADGLHTAEILSVEGKTRTVRLKMIDVSGIKVYGNPSGSLESQDGLCGYFLDTGTRHFVKMVGELADYDVFGEGRRIRYCQEFAPVGTNVNFVEPEGSLLKVRTYEKGVEDETYACGTGITASVIAAWHHCGLEGVLPFAVSEDGRVSLGVQALRDRLAVDFIPEGDGFRDVWLTGPAAFVGRVSV